MEDLTEKKTRLRRLRVYAVGLVDSPAIRRKFLILKRDTPTKKALTEAKFPTIHPPAQGAKKFCVCPKCGYNREHEAGKACDQYKCPKCGTKLVGSNTQRLKKQGGEKQMGKPNMKDAVIQATTAVLEKLDKGAEVAVKEKVGGPTEELEEENLEEEEGEEVIIDKDLEKEIEESAKGLEETEKSAYTDFMGKCLKEGKTMKVCAAEYKKAHPKEAKAKKKEVEKVKVKEIEKAKVKVSVETEEKEHKGDGEQKVAGTFAGAFGKVFSVFDRNIGAAKKDEEKRKWQALKALLSKTIGTLPIQKSDGLEGLQEGLDVLTGEVDTLLKANSTVPAGGFKPVFSALDKLIGTAEGGVKTALGKIKSMLSKLVGGKYPEPAAKGVVEITPPEELALMGQQIEELTGKIDKLMKGQADHQAMLEKIPVPKGLVKKEVPRKQVGESDDLLEKHKGESAPDMARSVIKELVEKKS